MKKIALIMTCIGFVSACTSDSGVPSFAGNTSTRGFCGNPNKPFENPITNDINPEHFEVLEDVEPGEYKAEQVLVYYRASEADLESPQALGVQNHVFLNGEFAPKTFLKDCARGLEYTSEGQHEVVLPIKVQLNANKTWKTLQAAKYSVTYSPSLSEGLVFKAELDTSASPASDDRDYIETLIITQTKAAKVSDVFEPMSYEEYRDQYIKLRYLSQFLVAESIDVTKEYEKYLKRAEARHKKLVTLKATPSQIFLQIEAQSDPKIYARIQISKVESSEPQQSED